MKCTAAIIGLGNIGQGYDYRSKANSIVLTHAKAYSTHRNFEIVAGIDPNSRARAKFWSRYHVPVYSRMHQFFENHRPDVVSICVPTDKHFHVFKEVVRYAPKAIVCEKPLSLNFSEARKMTNIARENNILLLVNYMRRFEPGLLSIKKMIDNNQFGKFVHGNSYYYGGFYNNASHLIDLFNFLFGAGHSPKLIDNRTRKKATDLELDFQITFGSTEVCFVHSKIKEYCLLEAEIFGTKGSIKFLNGGERILFRKVGSDSFFSRYRVLLCRESRVRTETNKLQLHVIDALYRTLTKNAKLNSTGETTLHTAKLMDNIRGQL